MNDEQVATGTVVTKELLNKNLASIPKDIWDHKHIEDSLIALLEEHPKIVDISIPLIVTASLFAPLLLMSVFFQAGKGVILVSFIVLCVSVIIALLFNKASIAEGRLIKFVNGIYTRKPLPNILLELKGVNTVTWKLLLLFAAVEFVLVLSLFSNFVMLIAASLFFYKFVRGFSDYSYYKDMLKNATIIGAYEEQKSIKGN